MASVVAEKLYPPTIPSSIPAFYVENGTAKIAVPFSMNRAVDADSVAGFRIKIKTVQSNTLVKTISIDNDAGAQAAINSRIAVFEWEADVNGNRTPDFNKIKMGQYLKVQMAYIGKNGQPGYFSTVAITKYTSKPLVSIANADVADDPNAIPVFKQSYTGVYQTTEDTSERPYSYCFYLFNALKGLEETSGWKLHNTSINRVASEAIALDQTVDTYTFTAPMQDDKLYYIQYGVRTINNLEVYSPLYPVFQALTDDAELEATLTAENNFDNAYIELKLVLNQDITVNTVWPKSGSNSYISIQIERASKTTNYQDWSILKKVAFLNYKEVANWSFKDFTIEQGNYYLYRFRQYSNNGISSKGSNIKTPIFADFEDMFLWDGEKQLKIRFNPKVSSFKTTLMEQKMETIGSQYPFIFKNGIVNYREFPIAGLISYNADNEELFLNKKDDLNIVISDDLNRQQNPTLIDEEQVEKQIAQLQLQIAQQEYEQAILIADYEEFLANNFAIIEIVHENGEVEIQENPRYAAQKAEREMEIDQIREKLNNLNNQLAQANELLNMNEISETVLTQLNNIIDTYSTAGYNMYAERIFKMRVLEWLNDGNIKMFKSPAEGNYLVRLMNISLTPEDKLGRMLHNFQATAYEMEALTYSNLIDLDFVSVDDYEVSKITPMTNVLIRTILNQQNNFSQNTSIPLNQYLIVNSLNIEPADGVSFFVRIGEDKPENKVYIGTNFTLAADATSLPSVWFNPQDNKELISSLIGGQPDQGNCATLVGDSTITYYYYATSTAIGDFYGIENITVKNKVETWNGPKNLSFGAVSVTNQGLNLEPVIMKFWALEFTKKVCKTKLIYKNNKYYLYDNQSVQVTIFDTSQLYQVMESPYAENSNVKIYYSEDGTTLIAGTNSYHIGFYDSSENANFYNDVDQHVTLSYSRDLTLEEQLAKDAALAAIDADSSLSNAEKQIRANAILNQYGPFEMRFETPPIINLYETMKYNRIEFGWGVTLKTAYQERTVKYH